MAINFPTSLDVFTDPTASDQLNLPSHSGQHTDLNNAVEALEAKVGADSSAVTSSHDYKIAQLEAQGAYTDYSGSMTFTNFTLGNGTINYAHYTRIGDFVHFAGQVTLGSTSSITGNLGGSLPIASDVRERGAGNSEFIDSGVGAYGGAAHANGSFLGIYCLDETGGFVRNETVISSRPFTWTTGDSFSWTVVYKAA